MPSTWYQKVSDAGAARGRRVESFGTDRVCAHDGCNTPLSRYNPDDCCAVHAEVTNS